MVPRIETAMNSRLRSRAEAVWEAKSTRVSTTFTSTAQSRLTTVPMHRRARSPLVFSVSAVLVRRPAVSVVLVRRGPCSKHHPSIPINIRASLARHTEHVRRPSSVPIHTKRSTTLKSLPPANRMPFRTRKSQPGRAAAATILVPVLPCSRVGAVIIPA